jgi:hypothetical protein
MPDLTDNQWKTAHAIARQIVQDGAYLRICADESDGGTRFFKYLGNLVGGGDRIGHSKRTVEYYRGLNTACLKYLKPLEGSPQVMLEILGWAGRLIPYYQGSSIAELANASMEIEAESAKQAEVKAAAAAAGFAVGQKVEAMVKAIKGKDVTYELVGGIKLTQKEPKKASDLTVGQSVQVEITEMRETGVPKKLKLAN